jgi:hypothetical protein
MCGLYVAVSCVLLEVAGVLQRLCGGLLFSSAVAGDSYQSREVAGPAFLRAAVSALTGVCLFLFSQHDRCSTCCEDDCSACHRKDHFLRDAVSLN